MKKLIILLLLFKVGFAFAQKDVKMKIVESFTYDVKNPKLSLATVAKSHLCAMNGDTMDLTLLQLKSLRDSIAGKKVTVQSFLQIPEKERNVSGGSPDHIFRVLADKKFICFILVESNKISSFATMRKGSDGERVFINLCKD